MSAQQTAVNKQVAQEGTQRLNTRNRQLRGKQFWNQNKKKSVTRIGSLAAFDTEVGEFKLEETVSDAEPMASIAQTYFASLFKPQVLRTDIQDMLVGLLDTVPEEMQISLGRNVTAREVEHVIRLMKKSVAPSQMAFQLSFTRHMQNSGGFCYRACSMRPGSRADCLHRYCRLRGRAPSAFMHESLCEAHLPGRPILYFKCHRKTTYFDDPSAGSTTQTRLPEKKIPVCDLLDLIR